MSDVNYFPLRSFSSVRSVCTSFSGSTPGGSTLFIVDTCILSTVRPGGTPGPGHRALLCGFSRASGLRYWSIKPRSVRRPRVVFCVFRHRNPWVSDHWIPTGPACEEKFPSFRRRTYVETPFSLGLGDEESRRGEDTYTDRERETHTGRGEGRGKEKNK